MTDVLTNPYNLEYRDTRDGRLVVYANRRIAKVTTDGTLMTHATEVSRAGNQLESLGLAKAMFLVESEEQLIGVLDWPGVAHFERLTLNLYFIPQAAWFMDRIREYAPRLQHLTSLEITGPVPLPLLMGDEALRLFPNTLTVKLLGHCNHHGN
jgi:hypothetical protein